VEELLSCNQKILQPKAEMAQNLNKKSFNSKQGSKCYSMINKISPTWKTSQSIN